MPSRYNVWANLMILAMHVLPLVLPQSVLQFLIRFRLVPRRAVGAGD